jgi:isopenicillin N synthase-like dioxygenase
MTVSQAVEASLLQTFIAIAPLALIFTAFFGDFLARWATLQSDARRARV